MTRFLIFRDELHLTCRGDAPSDRKALHLFKIDWRDPNAIVPVLQLPSTSLRHWCRVGEACRGSTPSPHDALSCMMQHDKTPCLRTKLHGPLGGWRTLRAP
ncbi:hypothetical protein PF010_g4139 [Phytophthora fragariae]|uniref:Uncharacterized protein n=1 Tax=Phytophthora fragariae TaxID=53985 RepID=A0A6G0LT15_9STRA|nr:hypothetical protein PF010_g4139 [Phytophthora fragariae]KAE9331865.1 hypothetical protein PF008_g15221 [Phytophthora fragariae]